MYYINTRNYGITETIDEFETLKEAQLMLIEYNSMSTFCYHYISTRSTKQWRER